jgi:hypothetical protein
MIPIISSSLIVVESSLKVWSKLLNLGRFHPAGVPFLAGIEVNDNKGEASGGGRS